jgi:hypothetical protein
MLREASGGRSVSRTAVFEWHSHFKARQVSVEDNKHSGQSSSSTTQKFKKFVNSSMKTVAE